MSRMRTRLIEPGFFQNEDLAALPPHGRLLFAGLWCLADREGRLDDRPPKIRALLFAYEEVPINELLDGLAKVGLVTRYEVDGRKYLQVNKFLEHQKPHQREEKSAIPPPGPAKVSPGLALEAPRRVVLVSDPVLVSVSESKTLAPSPSDSPPEAAAGAIDFPIAGKGQTWRLTKVAQDRLQLAFPALDVAAICLRARAWIEANPTKRKTARGMPKFLDAFIAREQENPRSAYRRGNAGSPANGNGAHRKAATLEPSAAMRFNMERTKLRAELFEREDLAEADRDRLVTALDAVQPSAGVAALRAAVSA